ncbi:gdsl lipase acylhydrolase family protein [Phlyctema vagabunda]|uniref:Gdsl lipase acylhydrolase family protein n=1 Tax=Phlyctema vagabunda TaxID=108571 RepID=A0ABR4P202_9HELO
MSTAKKYPQFLLFGDSITQYSSNLRDGFSFGAALAEHCERRLDIVNRGLSGYNTANALKIIEDIIPSTENAQVDYLLVAFGANDAALPGTTGQHVPLDEYKKNIEAIINHPRVKAHNPKILLVTPPPIDEPVCEEGDKARGYAEVTRRQTVTFKYAEAIRTIGAEAKEKEQNVFVVDLWWAMMNEAIKRTLDRPADASPEYLLGTLESGKSDGFRELLVDGLHFTGAGYVVFYEELVHYVGKGWKSEPIDNPRWVFPHWSIAPKI